MPLVPKFVADLFAIAASVRHLHGEYLAAEVKRQRMKEIVHVMQVAHAQELCELDVSEWPLKIRVGKQKAEDNRRPADIRPAPICLYSTAEGKAQSSADRPWASDSRSASRLPR
jgi:hypothetical protein